MQSKEKKSVRCIFRVFSVLFLLSLLLNHTAGFIVSGASAPGAPVIKATYSVMNQKATVTYQVTSKYKIKSVKYLRGNYQNKENTKWNTKAVDVTKKSSFQVSKPGNYSIMATDSKGNKTIYRMKVTLEFRAAWIAYYDFDKSRWLGQQDFTAYVDHMFDQVKSKNMNAVVVHVRPFSDAMYPSKYYPWSVYASGKQGVSPGYDPLEIMVKAAHKRGLEFHAWLNPYRISTSSTDITTLSSNHPARKWMEDSSTKNDRNVLAYEGKLYYNPSSSQVRSLITNGIKEIVTNYDVDGIHFDDYFYPEYLGTNYMNNFDAQEYNTYQQSRIKQGKSYMNIADWRRNNVNVLLKKIYSSVKAIDNTVQFGVSPGGYLDYLTMNDRNYVDFERWMSSDGYIDYICPQIYWSFSSANKFPYTQTINRWLSYRTSKSVKMYIGVGVYKLGITTEPGWTDYQILKNMVLTARATKQVDGFLFFDYADIVRESNRIAVNELVSVLK